jgi:hypothetical protein
MAFPTHNLTSEGLKKQILWISWNEVSWGQKAIRSYFLHPIPQKDILERNCLSDVLWKRLFLRTHNLPSERVKNQLCWLRWSNISRCRKAIWTHFLNSGHWKKRFWRSRGSNVSNRQMAQRPHNLTFGRLNKRLWWSSWSDVSKRRKALQNHFLRCDHRKKNFDEVA